MLRRHLAATALLTLLVAVAAGRVAAAPPGSTPPSAPPPTTAAPATTTTLEGENTDLGPDVTIVFQSPPLITKQEVVSGPLVLVPPGCSAPAPAAVVFVGKMMARSVDGAQFAIEQVRAGSASPFSAGSLVNVHFGDDARYLNLDEEYIVGAAPDQASGLLSSKVREAAPLFGGNAVIGISDSDVSCPVVEDPVRTLHLDGTAVDSGVLTKLKGAKASLLSAILRPLAVAFGALVALVLLKHLFFATGRSLRELIDDERPAVRRARRHGA